jgi:hypothetical protein
MDRVLQPDILLPFSLVQLMGEGWGGGGKNIAGKPRQNFSPPSPKPPPIKGRGLSKCTNKFQGLIFGFKGIILDSKKAYGLKLKAYSLRADSS